MQLERHPDPGSDDPPQQLHVCKHPLVPHRVDPDVAFEQGVETVEEELDAKQH